MASRANSSGAVDALAEEALCVFREGRCPDLRGIGPIQAGAWEREDGAYSNYSFLHRSRKAMLAIRGTYNGKVFTTLPTENLPRVEQEVPVAMIFLEDATPQTDPCQQQAEIARRMKAAREAMPPLGVSITELIEEGRDR